MRVHKGSRFLLSVVLGFSTFSGASVWAQAKPAAQKAYEDLIFSVRGPDLFRAHCAACHGPDAKGGGPVAAGLKATVPNLTLLAKNSGGIFPEARAR
jgi:mono/diheme cytochrome c family protein